MGVEIERKFLVDKGKWRKIKPDNGVYIVQGYILNETDKSVRVRLKGEKGFLTIKGGTNALSRIEFEYEIPASEAKELLTQFCPKSIEKHRFEVQFEGKTWEVDEFISPNPSLILAEVELDSENEIVQIPTFITEEVTGQKAYYNSEMLKQEDEELKG